MSEIKVNKISPRSGTTVTLGDSGDTFTIPSGATINNQGTAVNFGATGSASWVTTVKTSGFTAVAGEGYFVDTTSGAISVNLPAGSAGAVVAFKDYAGTFSASNKVTLVQNGSDKIGGSTINATLETEGIAVTLVFIDSTQGWLVTDSGLQSEAPTAAFIAASGGTESIVCTNFKVHTFTGPGTFTVSAVGNAAGSNTIDYLVVGGAGAGGGNNPSAYADGSGGGGAGGVRMSSGVASGCYAASPLGACVSALPVTATGYPVVVGGGGASTPGPGTARGCNGVNSVFSGSTTITAAGGGGGGTHSYTTPLQPNRKGNDGGSGGGPGGGFTDASNFGAGNTPPVSPPQGQNGGIANSSPDTSGAGGGGAGGAGTPGGPGCSRSGDGGIGITNAITGSNVVYAGGGGGANGPPVSLAGGFGGINPGGTGPAPQADRGGAANGTTPGCGVAGSANTGGGGGAGAKGNSASSIGGTGGSGIVVIRYKFQ